ncbi:DUF6175 family protein [Runella sp. MFBS21]|uniref:DUF6175 family protein n=1 Tax=Runella sp. MFBS21 TaxID=3034018 RepID=UPI0023F89ACA|nr:DUF6175 family protein [Runella sp. MFBS21]MDF7819088.1 DUF6175 family protein [Runella sp. MFBS21]
MRYIVILIWGILHNLNSLGQYTQKKSNEVQNFDNTLREDSLKKKLVTQPTIMVFPMFKEGQNLREVVENDANSRIVMTKVKELFDKRGYSTVDFLSKARNLALNEVLTSENQSDIKTQIISGSGADICVEVEYVFSETANGNELSVTLNAYESSTSMTLSSKVGNSGKFYTQDMGRLINRAIDPISEDFLNVMQQKFNDIVENGRYLSLEFSLAESADFDMTTEIGVEALPLSDVLEEWVATNTKSYHIQGVTSLKTIFDVIRVSRHDIQGRPLTTTRYALDIMRFCNQLSLANKKDRKLKAERLIKGNTILMTLK